MYTKSLFLVTPLILIFSTAVHSEIYCPPDEVVHCTKGICTVDSPYSNDWRVFVTGQPDGSLKLSGVSIYNPPRTAICQYGNAISRNKKFYTLRSVSNYSPNFKAPGNQWRQLDGNFYGCWESRNRMDCPMQ